MYTYKYTQNAIRGRCLHEEIRYAANKVSEKFKDTLVSAEEICKCLVSKVGT